MIRTHTCAYQWVTACLYQKVLRYVIFEWPLRLWRRKCEVNSISKPQLQIGFKRSWKLCLELCSCKLLRHTGSHVISLVTLWLLQLKTLFGECLINFRMLFLKTTKLFKFRRVGSKFSHSMIEGKKEFLEKVVYNVNPFTRTRYPAWLKKIQLILCNSYGGFKTISNESFAYVT